MATRTATQNGLWSDPATWGGIVPVNGDAVVINTGVTVTYDVDQSGFANGLLSLQIDGKLTFKPDTNTCLKMNGNITGTGALYICERATVTGFTLTTGKTNTYQVSRSLDVATVEDTLGDGYLDAVEELVEVAIDTENAARVAQGLNEMMPDAVQIFIESTRASSTLSQILAYVEATQGSFYHDTVNDVLYIHTSDSTDPSGKTITVIEPINRPASGSEYRCYILFNSTGTIAMTGTPIIRMYGWYPEREWTQLSAGADSGATVLPPLDHDLGLQQGDKIGIGCGNEAGQQIESNAGIYTVVSYDSNTKIITLTGGLQTARLNGDYVEILSRPIKISRASGSAGLIVVSSGIAVGVNANNLPFVSGSYTNQLSRWAFKHCTTQGPTGHLLGYGLLASFKDCNVINFAYIQKNTLDSIIERPTSINAEINYGGSTKTKDGNFQNIVPDNPSSNSNYFYNCRLKNHKSALGFVNRFINCEFMTNEVISVLSGAAQICGCINCIFDFTVDGFSGMYGKLHNCLFMGNDGVYEYTSPRRQVNHIIESFDHNQLPENYKAWMRGGKIETDTEDTTILPGRLILNCESADYPVFRDFQVQLPQSRTMRWQALTRKSFSGGSVKIELIDPTADPLIDSSAQPLASYSLPDQANTSLPLKLGYKSTVPMQAILRISAQKASGTVEIDTRLIENRVQHGR